MKTLTISKQTINGLRSVASGIGALALLTLMALSSGGATALAQAAPTITLTPGEYKGRPTLQATASETVDNWQYLRSSNDFDCVGATFDQHTPVADLSYIFVPADQGDMTYCFRAQNDNDVWGYAKHRFDFNPPQVTKPTLNSQPGRSTLTLTVNEPVVSHYHVSYNVGGSNTCDQNSANWPATPTGLEVIIRQPQHICFQLTDQSNKVTYYSYEVTSVKPLVKPEITVSYYADREVVEATANKTINSWAHVVSSQDLGDCKIVDYSSPTGRTRTATYTPSRQNQHYYFQGTDADNQKACGKVTVLAAIANPNPVVTKPPTTTKPTTTPTNTQTTTAPDIEIAATGRQITASHSEPVAKWRHYRSPSTPICDSSVVWDESQNPSIARGRQLSGLTESDIGQWVCFRALLLGTTYRGQEVYKAVQIANTWYDPTNTQTLTIRFEQSPTTLTATADPAVDSSRFQYLAYSGERYPNGPNCRHNNPHMTAEYWTRYKAKTGNVVKLVPAAEGYYYCFRVTDDQGGASYAMYRVGGIRQETKTKPPVQTTPTTTPTTTPPQETASPRLQVEISQTATTITATTNVAAPGASWQSLKFSGQRYPNGPNCSLSNPHMTAAYWAKWETGSSNSETLQASDEGKFYCFRVVDANGNVAIGQHKVTGVQVTQTQTQPTQTNQPDDSGSQTTVTPPAQTTAAPVVNVVTTAPQTPAPQVTVNPGPAPQVTVNPAAPQVTVNPAPAPQVTVTTQAPDSQPVPIDLTVNIPESALKTETPEPDTEPAKDDNSVVHMLWGLGGAIVTLIVLTTILAVVNRDQRR